MLELLYILPEACNDADILEDAYRYYNNTDATGNCDIHRNEGWVRFKYNGLNAEIPTVCIKVHFIIGYTIPSK